RMRARLYLDADEPKRAAEQLEQAVKVDRHDHASRLLLADAYQRLQRPADAAGQRYLAQQTIEQLHELTRLSAEATAKPWDAAVRKRLAAICEQVDKPDLARMWLEA